MNEFQALNFLVYLWMVRRGKCLGVLRGVYSLAMLKRSHASIVLVSRARVFLDLIGRQKNRSRFADANRSAHGCGVEAVIIRMAR